MNNKIYHPGEPSGILINIASLLLNTSTPNQPKKAYRKPFI
ncbi:hypothetical protein [Epilithonimonas hominis]|nr:hypothetical protein [Epilithonimonas hominis]